MYSHYQNAFEYCVKELKKHDISYVIYEINSELLEKVNFFIWKKMDFIYKFAEKTNCHLAIVGGFVRDILMENPSNDVDIVLFSGNIDEFTSDIAKRMDAKIGKMNNKTLTTQIRFKDGLVFEFNQIRKEKYDEFPSRQPKVEEGTIVEDLKRRDFTINTFLMFGTQYIDIFGGKEDLEKKIIDTTRTPVIVFKEDYLRMFRAVRFACKLDFMIAKRVKDGIKKNAKNLKKVPHERIVEELKESVRFNSKKMFNLLVQLEIVKVLIPELKNKQLNPNLYVTRKLYDKIEKKLHYIDKRSKKIEDIILMKLTPIFMEIGRKAINIKNDLCQPPNLDAVSKVLRRFKFSNEEIYQISLLSRNTSSFFYFVTHDCSLLEKRKFLLKVGIHLEAIITLAKSENRLLCDPLELSPLISELKDLNKDRSLIDVEPALDGFQIQEIFNFEGKEIGQAKELLVDAIMAEKIVNNEKECIDYIKKNEKEIKN